MSGDAAPPPASAPAADVNPATGGWQPGGPDMQPGQMILKKKKKAKFHDPRAKERFQTMVDQDAHRRFDKQIRIWMKLKKPITDKKKKTLWNKMVNRSTKKLRKKEKQILKLRQREEQRMAAAEAKRKAAAEAAAAAAAGDGSEPSGSGQKRKADGEAEAEGGAGKPAGQEDEYVDYLSDAHPKKSLQERRREKRMKDVAAAIEMAKAKLEAEGKPIPKIVVTKQRKKQKKQQQQQQQKGGEGKPGAAAAEVASAEGGTSAEERETDGEAKEAGEQKKEKKEKKKDKKEKKDKKAKREAAAEEEADEEMGQAEAAEQPQQHAASGGEEEAEDEAGGKGKEKKKKDKKDKKDKKGKKGAAAEAAVAAQPEPSGPSPLAAVGDAKLAASLPKLHKALYMECAEVAALSGAEVAAIRAASAMAVEGSSLKPVVTFAQTGLPAAMLHATRTFAKPSPIQAQAWPIVMSGRDMVGIAATGSGKTLAFGLPALRHIAAQRQAGVYKSKGPYAVVMAPTRELALQIAEVLEEAGSQCGCRCVCVYGGVPKAEQVAALKRGVEILVGTPGRLEDLMQDGVCKLSEASYLVLDEADRMLDLGFEPHIRAIASTIRSDRQTLMFSATWPAAVQKLAAQFLSRPVKVTIGSQDLSASHSIKQVVEVIEPDARDARLLELLSKYHGSRTNRCLIFVLYKKEAPRVEALLQRRGWKAAAIHGDLSQPQRTKAVEAFKDGTIPLLIATDVAARGLDIPDVEVVINYSFPLTTEDYVHRIGRTGRAGKSGLAHTFFVGVNDKARSGELINVLTEAGQPVPEELLKFGTTVKKKESALYGAHFKDVDFSAKATKKKFDDDD